ncbi:MAG: hypothetical protein H7338_00410 [Candidatus Sericytochromatia bacterium]|nr:hypothetical protein [Candidatus Sericytochromatia bacterium]
MRAFTAVCLTGVSLAATALIAGCPGAPPTTIPASNSPLGVSVIGLTQMKNDGTTYNSIAVNWRGIPSGTSQVDLNRSMDAGSSTRIRTATPTETTYTDRDVLQGKSYQYSVTPFDAKGARLVEPTRSETIRLASASDIPASSLTSPANNAFVSRSDEVRFAWQPVTSADYYWIQVRETGADSTKLTYSALTKDASIALGTRSTVVVPASLSGTLPTANEGVQNGKVYSVMVTTLKTDPPGGDLATLKSLAMRDSASQTFGVN